MKHFDGFPSRTNYSAVPEMFLTQVMPGIADIDELKATLAFFVARTHKKGYARFVRLSELVADSALAESFAKRDPAAAVADALDKACQRGTILKVGIVDAASVDYVYFLNTESDREVAGKVASGVYVLPGIKAMSAPPELERNDIFSNYEKNIGMITPLIAEELKDAGNNFPEEWINEAIKEAANHNKRSWSYISAILERWGTEGKTGGTYRGRPGTDPDKFIKGKYGHMVQR